MKKVLKVVLYFVCTGLVVSCSSDDNSSSNTNEGEENNKKEITVLKSMVQKRYGQMPSSAGKLELLSTDTYSFVYNVDGLVQKIEIQSERTNQHEVGTIQKIIKYNYNAQKQLVSYAVDSEVNNEKAELTYTYDTKGKLVRKYTKTAGGNIEINYNYDEKGLVKDYKMANSLGVGAFVDQFVYEGQQLVKMKRENEVESLDMSIVYGKELNPFYNMNIQFLFSYSESALSEVDSFYKSQYTISQVINKDYTTFIEYEVNKSNNLPSKSTRYFSFKEDIDKVQFETTYSYQILTLNK
jgi:hypothetical protein